jgi:hypothetical protein
MAYWLRPGQICTAPDGVRRKSATPGRVSDVIYSQSFTPAWGAPGAVHAEITFTTERGRDQAVVEVLTAYVPTRFSAAHLFDRSSGRLRPDPAAGPTSGEQAQPVVLATPDGRSAIGLLSLEGDASPRYGRVLLPEVGKINIVHRPDGPYAAGDHRYRCVWIVGSLAEVEAALRALS